MFDFSDTIFWEAVGAVATFLAVVAALLISYRDRRNRIKEQKEITKKELISGLVGLHELTVRCSKRTKEYWDTCKPDGYGPSFRIPSITYDEIVRVAPRLFSNPTDVELAIQTISEYHHLNDKFDALERYSLMKTEGDMALTQQSSKTIYSVYESSSYQAVQERLYNNVMVALYSLEKAVPVVHKLNYSLMRIIEDEKIDGKPLKTIVTFKCGSHTEKSNIEEPVEQD